jgi:ATP-dependent Clp protease ATP-binding subunit ClpA
MFGFTLLKKLLKKLGTQKDSAFSNFTPRAQQVLALAREESDRLHHNYIGTEHVLLGLIALGKGVAVNVLSGLGINLENIRIEVEKQTGIGPVENSAAKAPFTPRVKKVLAYAREEAVALHHTYIGTEHLLLGLLREGDSIGAQALRNFDVDLKQLRISILKELDPNIIPEKDPNPVSSEETPKDWFKSAEELQKPRKAEKVSFTPRARQVLQLARKEADRLHHNFLGTEHQLVGLIELGGGVASNVLVKKGMNLEKVRAELAKGPDEKMPGIIPYTPRVKRILEMARDEAKTLNHKYIGTEHLLLGLLCEKEGPAAFVFKKFNVDMEALRQEVLKQINPF